MPHALTSFATASRGLEPLLAREVAALGAHDVKEQGGGCAFRAISRPRIAPACGRGSPAGFLLPLSRFPLADAGGDARAAH